MGPALELWQVEPPTHENLCSNQLNYRPEMMSSLMELRSRAWSRENLMRYPPNQITLMQMMAPDWTDWGWKIDPKFLEEAVRFGAKKRPNYILIANS